MTGRTPRRVVRLSSKGTLLASTDLHGNGQDFRALRAVFLSEREREPETHWVVLGDAVHGPSDEARAGKEPLYDFLDESVSIIEGLSALMREHPGRVHYVLGNHDFAHVGGPPTAKFHPDEAGHLESTLPEADRRALRGFFSGALLAVAAPCGVLLTHGSPDEGLVTLDDLDGIELPPRPEMEERLWKLLWGLLTSYGQKREVTERVLSSISRPGMELKVVVHGHDRDEKGWFTEGGNQVCPVLFGAVPSEKRFLRLDLAGRYSTADDFREGIEVRRLYQRPGSFQR